MTEIVIYPTLYKKDNNGSIREWRLERRDHEYRTVSNVQGGTPVVSEWKAAKAKGVGKAARDAVVQAQMQIESTYKKRRETAYHDRIEDVDKPIKFNPMLAEKYQGWLGPCYSQPKLDGIRCIARADGLWSRNGKPIKGAPHIFEALVPFFEEHPDAILDGELYNHDLKDDFNKIISCVKKQNPTEEHLKISRENVQYHIYDLPSHDGNFLDRSLWLFHTINKMWALYKTDYLVLVETLAHKDLLSLDETYGKWLQEGYEGQMVRLNEPYENRRTVSLLKRKEFVDEEFPLVSINEGQGNWGGVAKAVTCRLPNGKTFNAGIKGNRDRAKALLHEKYAKVTVRYQNLTPDGVPRFPVAIKFWDEEGVELDR